MYCLRNHKQHIVRFMSMVMLIAVLYGCEFQQTPAVNGMLYIKNETRFTLIVTATDLNGQPAILSTSEVGPGEFAHLYSASTSNGSPVQVSNAFRALTIYEESINENNIKYAGINDEDWQPDTLPISGNAVLKLTIY